MSALLIPEAKHPEPMLSQVPLGDVMNATIEPVRFAVKPLMPRRHVTLFGGHGGVGKSGLMLAIGAHVAAGVPFAEMEVERLHVVFVSLEDEPSIVRLRLRRIIEAYNLPAGQVLERMTLLDGTQAFAALMTEGDRQTPAPQLTKAYRELAKQAEGAGLIIIDNASDAFDANENSRRDVRAFVRSLAVIARANNAAVVLLAHIDKAAARGGSQGNSYSGSTAWHNSARSRLALVDHDGRTQLIHEKHNLGPLADTLELAFVNGVLMPCDACNEVTELRPAFDAQEVYNVMSVAIHAGIDVPTATRGPSTTWHALEPLPELGKDYRTSSGKKRFAAAVMKLFRDGRIAKESYTSAGRNQRERWKLTNETNADTETCALVSSEKVRVDISPIPPIETNAGLGAASVPVVIAKAETNETDETNAPARFSGEI